MTSNCEADSFQQATTVADASLPSDGSSQTSTSADSNVSCTRLFIGALATETTAESFEAELKKYGVIHRVDLPLIRPGGNHRGFGFADCDPETAERIVQLGRKVTVDGKPVDPKLAKTREEAPPAKPTKPERQQYIAARQHRAKQRHMSFPTTAQDSSNDSQCAEMIIPTTPPSAPHWSCPPSPHLAMPYQGFPPQPITIPSPINNHNGNGNMRMMMHSAPSMPYGLIPPSPMAQCPMPPMSPYDGSMNNNMHMMQHPGGAPSVPCAYDMPPFSPYMPATPMNMRFAGSHSMPSPHYGPVMPGPMVMPLPPQMCSPQMNRASRHWARHHQQQQQQQTPFMFPTTGGSLVAEQSEVTTEPISEQVPATMVDTPTEEEVPPAAPCAPIQVSTALIAEKRGVQPLRLNVNAPPFTPKENGKSASFDSTLPSAAASTVQNSPLSARSCGGDDTATPSQGAHVKHHSCDIPAVTAVQEVAAASSQA